MGPNGALRFIVGKYNNQRDRLSNMEQNFIG